MARNVTITDLITRAKRVAGMENESSVSDAEWQIYVVQAKAEMDMIVQNTGCDALVTEQSIVSNGSSVLPDLPGEEGLEQIRSVEYRVSSTVRRRLRRIMREERDDFQGATGSEAVGYFVQGHDALTAAGIYLYPTPPTGQTYVVTYEPLDDQTLEDADPSTSIDTLTVHGEKFIRYTAAAEVLAHEESDPNFALMKAAEAKERLEWWAINRMREEGRRIVEPVDEYYLPGDYIR